MGRFHSMKKIIKILPLICVTVMSMGNTVYAKDSTDFKFKDYAETEKNVEVSRVSCDSLSNYSYIDMLICTEITDATECEIYAQKETDLQVDTKNKREYIAIKTDDSSGTSSEEYFNDKQNEYHSKKVGDTWVEASGTVKSLTYDTADNSVSNFFMTTAGNTYIPMSDTKSGIESDGKTYISVNADVDSSLLDGYDYDSITDRKVVFIVENGTIKSIVDKVFYTKDGVAYCKKVIHCIKELSNAELNRPV